MGFFSKNETYCVNCQKETNGKILCRECNKQTEGTVYYCDECMEEFSRNQVVYVGYSNGGYLCHGCYEK